MKYSYFVFGGFFDLQYLLLLSVFIYNKDLLVLLV